MKLALGPVQSNAKGGRYVSLEDSEEIFYRRNCAVEILWEPGNFQDDGAKRLGICFTADPDLRDWVLSVEDTVVDNMIVQQGPFPGASRTELEAQLQSAVKVSPKGQHVKAKINLERCVYWDSNGKPAPQPSEFARRRGRAVIEARQVWLMGRQFGVLFEVRHLTLDAVEAPCCPFISSISSEVKTA